MRTYHCHKCGATKKQDPKKWGMSNLESYCNCNPDAPFLMSPTSAKELDKKYGNIWRKMEPVVYHKKLFADALARGAFKKV